MTSAHGGSLAFVCVGLETRFVSLLTTDRGRPALLPRRADHQRVLDTATRVALFGGVIFAQPAIQ
jgi:hypothetical protein